MSETANTQAETGKKGKMSARNTEFIQGINETLGGLNPLMFVVAFVGVNGALEMPSSCIVGGIVSKAVNRALYTKKEA